MIVVTPTLKAARVAATEVGSSAFSAAWLVHQHGFRWDADGHWTRVAVDRIDRAAVLMPGDELVVDEAGMLDQDTARALLTIADEAGARLVLVGDRHQLPAVGRGGVLDLALRWAPPEAVKQLTTVHRFADPAYAELSLKMRSGEHSGEVFDTLLERGEIVVHGSEIEAIEAIAAAHGWFWPTPATRSPPSTPPSATDARMTLVVAELVIPMVSAVVRCSPPAPAR